MAKADVYMVTDSFVGTLDGKELEFHRGDLLMGDNPAVRRWPKLFEPLVVAQHSVRGVEQATAAPGEKRGTAITTARYRGGA